MCTRSALPLGVYVWLGGQGPQRWTVEALEERAPRARQLLEGPRIELLQQSQQCLIELGPSEKNWAWRSRGKHQRSTTCTPTSTLALSRGRRTRAGMTATP
jgi:hypothetical protein